MPKTMRDNMDPKQRAILEDTTIPKEVREALFVVWTRCANLMSMVELRETPSVLDFLVALHNETPKLVEKLRAKDPIH